MAFGPAVSVRGVRLQPDLPQRSAPRTREGKPSRFASRWRQAFALGRRLVRAVRLQPDLPLRSAPGTREGKPPRFGADGVRPEKHCSAHALTARAVGPRVLDMPCDQQAAFLVIRKMRVTTRGPPRPALRNVFRVHDGLTSRLAARDGFPSRSLDSAVWYVASGFSRTECGEGSLARSAARAKAAALPSAFSAKNASSFPESIAADAASRTQNLRLTGLFSRGGRQALPIYTNVHAGIPPRRLVRSALRSVRVRGQTRTFFGRLRKTAAASSLDSVLLGVDACLSYEDSSRSGS